MKGLIEAVTMGLGMIAFAVGLYVMMCVPALLEYSQRKMQADLCRLPSYGEACRGR